MLLCIKTAELEKTERRRPLGDTRERILRATFELISRDGIAALSNRRVAAEVGISPGSLTYHFPSQTELLRESLEFFVENEVARMEQVAADLRARRATPADVAAEVQRLASEGIGSPERIAELELHLRAARDPALREASRRSFVAYEAVAAAALAAFHVDEPERHARAVVALMIGVSLKMQGMGGGEPVGLVDALETIVRGARRSQRHKRGD